MKYPTKQLYSYNIRSGDEIIIDSKLKHSISINSTAWGHGVGQYVGCISITLSILPNIPLLLTQDWGKASHAWKTIFSKSYFVYQVNMQQYNFSNKRCNWHAITNHFTHNCHFIIMFVVLTWIYMGWV